MKKKASLLISGITTVAMLAVAVGSFAAWDTLTGKTDESNKLNISVGDPVVLKVENTSPYSGTQKLAKIDSAKDISDANRVSEASVGSFDVTLTNADNVAKKKKKTTFTSATIEGATDPKIYDVLLYQDAGPTGVAIGSDLTLTAGTKSNVTAKIKFKDSATEEAIKKDAGKNLTVVVQLDTTKTGA